VANPGPKPQPLTIVAVALGGVIGAMARVYLPWPNFTSPAAFGDPLPTLLANLIGAILLGFFAGYATRHNWPEALHKGISVGLLGSFTTMSGLALSISLIATGQYAFDVELSLTTVWVGLLLVLALVMLLGLTTLLTLGSYRFGLRKAGT